MKISYFVSTNLLHNIRCLKTRHKYGKNIRILQEISSRIRLDRDNVTANWSKNPDGNTVESEL